MQIKIACERCGESNSVDSALYGRRVNCNSCRSSILIPVSSSVSADQSKFRSVFIAMASLSLTLGVLVALIWINPFGNSDSPNDKSSSSPSTQQTLRTPPANTRRFHEYADKNEQLFKLDDIPTPIFPDLERAKILLPSKAKVYFIDLSREPENNPSVAGMSMKMRVYLPPGNHAPQSLACVLVTPAGTKLLHGNNVDEGEYHKETKPYVDAGMAVIFYSLDGPLSNQKHLNDLEIFKLLCVAYPKYKAAKAGVVNGRNALDFALSKLPEVDPEKIYCAGHSSAGTLSLLLAEHEPRIKACVAYAASTDIEGRLKDFINFPKLDEALPGIKGFVKQASPKTHTSQLKCPVFLFHAKDDSNVPFANTLTFARRLEKQNANVTFSESETGDHYRSMINDGIPRAIEWMQNLPDLSNN